MEKKNNFVSFLLGLIIGNKILPIAMHVFYLVIIGILGAVIYNLM